MGASAAFPGAVFGLTGSVKQEKDREESAEKTIAREITTTAGTDVTQTHSTTCSADDALKSGGVGLWQWVLETEDHSTTASTAHTVCRFGALALTAPACFWMDCLNDDCSECKK